jgi:DNA-binding transcriptional ArsR family regulator
MAAEKRPLSLWVDILKLFQNLRNRPTRHAQTREPDLTVVRGPQHYSAMAYEEIQQSARRASILLKAMSNERRLMILCHLSGGEQSVNCLCRLVGLSQSALSQHLAKLRRDGLVCTRRDAQTLYYSVNSGEVRQVLDTLHALYCHKRVDGR